ncbi:hypothetical protein thsps21_07450 [Pseudomonas sp. No.21]|nr:hypothetical protein TUM20249_03450 [Pseudomonas tohonis]
MGHRHTDFPALQPAFAGLRLGGGDGAVGGTSIRQVTAWSGDRCEAALQVGAVWIALLVIAWFIWVRPGAGEGRQEMPSVLSLDD